MFWDLYGKLGHPVRTTVSEMGPTLLGRMLELNDTQSGVLEIAFKLADDRGLLLLDLDDLRALLGVRRREPQGDLDALRAGQHAVGRRDPARAADAGARRRRQRSSASRRSNWPTCMRTDLNGRGIINILAADQLILKPRLYSSFLLWLLSELFENLPEVGDLDKPKLVFFFDEAHLLFDDAPPALRQRVEQVVRLIRSKGVGVYFCSQFPDDVPNEILGQLGNRIQHALRAYTPRDQKAVRTAAETFVANPKLDVAEVISQLGVGEALVSTLQEKGVPMPVERTLMCAAALPHGLRSRPRSAPPFAAQPVGAKYDTAVNRESAYEILGKRNVPRVPPVRRRGRAEELTRPARDTGATGRAVRRRRAVR